MQLLDSVVCPCPPFKNSSTNNHHKQPWNFLDFIVFLFRKQRWNDIKNSVILYCILLAQISLNFHGFSWLFLLESWVFIGNVSCFLLEEKKYWTNTECFWKRKAVYNHVRFVEFFDVFCKKQTRKIHKIYWRIFEFFERRG